MGVIPLVDDETVVDSRAAFDANGGLGGNLILIQDIDSNQLVASQEANATYDLCVGPEYRFLHSPQKCELPDGEYIELLRGESVLIQTAEVLCLPKTVFGIVLTKVSLVQKGASNDASKVDPGYNGQLIVTVTNFGKEAVKLYRGKGFCSIVFFRVEGEARPYDKPSKRIVGSSTTLMRSRFNEYIEKNVVRITITNLVINIILVLAIVIIFMK